MNSFFDVSSPKNRERLLVVSAGVLFLVMVVPLFYYLFGSDVAKLRRQRDALRTDVEKLKHDIDKKDEIKRRLAELAAESLPSNDRAQSLYQNWLIYLADEVGIRDKRIDPGSIAPMKELYKKYTFTLHGKGTLEQLTEFLRLFHKTKYLHLIRKVSPRSVKGSKDLEFSITVEALGLPQAKSSSSLPPISKESLAASDAEKTTGRQISERAFFFPYTPPPPAGRVEAPPPKKTDEFDHSPYCFITAVVEVDGKSQVWVEQRTEGKKHKLFEGEMFRLGGVRCFVKKIEYDKVLFEAAGGEYSIRVGKSFAEFD